VLTRGREQEVINHIGILAAAPPEVAVVPRAIDDALPSPPPMPMARPTPLPPRLSLGQMRETIALAIAWGAPIGLSLAIACLVRRWRNRRATREAGGSFGADMRRPERG